MTTPPQRQPKGTPTGGQFAPSARAEAEVSLAEQPMSAAEFATFADLCGRLRRLDADQQTMPLPDGSTVTVERDDPNDPFFEFGAYVVDHGDTRIEHPYDGATERGQVADRIAQAAVVNARGQAAAPAEQETDDEYEHPLFGKVIHSYTRSQALRDGFLRDYTDLAREAGFKVPVAVTDHVYADAISWSDDEDAYQDESGRAWDVMWMAYNGARRAAPGTNRTEFQMLRIPRGGHEPEEITLVLHIGPGDNAEPVATIMYPGDE